jgi:uncharacterized protein YecT (DUF1311 family)
MKSIIYCLLLFLSANNLLAQTQEMGSFTPAQIQLIKASVERKALIFLKELESDNYSSAGSREFTLDTFKAEETARMKIDIAESPYATNEALYELEKEYDKILNKYYNRLKNLLNPEDQKILIQAQRAWLAYQTAENQLIQSLMSPENAGDMIMSIMTSVSQGLTSSVLIKRTHEIGAYYQMVADTKANGE